MAVGWARCSTGPPDQFPTLSRPRQQVPSVPLRRDGISCGPGPTFHSTYRNRDAQRRPPVGSCCVTTLNQRTETKLVLHRRGLEGDDVRAPVQDLRKSPTGADFGDLSAQKYARPSRLGRYRAPSRPDPDVRISRIRILAPVVTPPLWRYRGVPVPAKRLPAPGPRPRRSGAPSGPRFPCCALPLRPALPSTRSATRLLAHCSAASPVVLSGAGSLVQRLCAKMLETTGCCGCTADQIKIRSIPPTRLLPWSELPPPTHPLRASFA